eukprot:COSAG02_NODE_7621_length_2930_cov_15.463519_4_plen_89_part_00
MLLNNVPQTANSLGGGQAEPALFVMIMSTTCVILIFLCVAANCSDDIPHILCVVGIAEMRLGGCLLAWAQTSPLHISTAQRGLQLLLR